jgi:subtilisin family serine protease
MMFRRSLLVLLGAISSVVATQGTEASAGSQPVVLIVIDSRAETPDVYTRTAGSEAEALSIETSLEQTPGVSVSRRTYLELLDAPPTDPLASSQWALPAIDAAEANALVGDGSGVKVAVVDTGIADHADLAGRVIASEDFVGTPGTHFHGTNVAGIIAATANNGIGVRGVAPGVSLLDARVCMDVSAYGCPSDLVAKGIIWAVAEHADVINLSLGGDFDEAIAAAVAYAISQNVVVVAAAGNTACRHMLSGYQGGEGPNGNCLSTATSSTWPANLDGVIAVGAILSDGTRASYSSYGPQITIGAPTDVLSTNFIQYGTFGGTSAAAPHVAAVAALMHAANPVLTPSAVKAMLMRSATAYQTPLKHQTWESCGSYLPSQGYWDSCTGLSDSAVPTRQLGGAGFLNALGAVTEAKNSTLSSWAPVVNPTTDGVTVSFSPVAGATSYDVFVDGAVAARTTATTTSITGLTLGASYAISVRANRQTSILSTPVLGAPALTPLSAPVLQRADSNFYGGTNIRVTAASNTSLAGGLEVSKIGTTSTWSCWHPSGDVIFQCETMYITNTTDQYRARYVTRYGAFGEWSQPFTFNSAYNATLATPAVAVTALSGSYLVDITPVVGAVRYVFTAGLNWAHVSSTGAVLRNSGNDVTCTLEAHLLCEVSAEPGVVYQVSAAAARDLSPDSGVGSSYSPTRRVVVSSNTPQFSNVRGSMISSSVLRVRWDSTAVRTLTENVGFDVYASVGVGVGSSQDADGWYADIPVDARTPDVFDVTVVGWRWSEPVGHPAWLTLGEQRSASLAVAPIAPPTGVMCQLSSTSMGCTFNAALQMTPSLRYGYELRRNDGSVVNAGTAPWGATRIDVPNVLAEAVYLALRVEEAREWGRNSAWALTSIARTDPPTPASPPSVTPPPAVTPAPESPSLPSTTPPSVTPPLVEPAPVTPAPVVVVPDTVRTTVKGRSVAVKWSKAPRGTTRILVLKDKRQVASLPATSTTMTLRNVTTGRHSILIVFVKKSGSRSTSGSSVVVR